MQSTLVVSSLSQKLWVPLKPDIYSFGKNPTSLKFIPNVPCSTPINQVIDLGKRDTSHHFHFLQVQFSPNQKKKMPKHEKKYIPISRRKDPTSRRSCVSSSVFFHSPLFGNSMKPLLEKFNSYSSDKRRKTLHIFRR